jgi:hypothetical protein
LSSDAAIRLAYIRDFRDDAGHRREVDRPFLSHVLGVEPGPMPEWIGASARAWWALHGREPWDALVDLRAAGRFFPSLAGDAIEVWTDAELATLHAMSWACMRERDAARAATFAKRMLSAAAWLIDEVQPDNATQRPWAIHVFAAIGTEWRPPCDAAWPAWPAWPASQVANADHYAQTLLHNALVAREAMDKFSAWIARDSAVWLWPAQPGDRS